MAIDINQQRLDFAKANGFASQVHCLSIAQKPKTYEEQLRTARENVSQALSTFQVPDGFDIVFECTGAEPCIQMSIYVSMMVLGRGGVESLLVMLNRLPLLVAKSCSLGWVPEISCYPYQRPPCGRSTSRDPSVMLILTPMLFLSLLLEDFKALASW